MKHKWKNIFLISSVLFSFLVFYNFFNSSLVIKKYEKSLINTQKRFYENPSKNILINPVNYRYNKISILNEFLTNDAPAFSLICVFDGRGCNPCIINEINLINEIYLKYPNNIKAFFVGDNSHNMKVFNPLFEFIILNSYDSLFMNYIIYPRNTIFLINKYGEVMDIHRPERDIGYKSELFYKRVEYLLKICD